MNQSRTDSFMESLVNIIIGLVVSTIANWLILPTVLGVSMTLGQNVLIGLCFTLISLVRSYVIRRAFNGRSVWESVKAVAPVSRARYDTAIRRYTGLRDIVDAYRRGETGRGDLIE